MIPKVIMMIGLPYSGKTYKAKELAEKYNATLFSSDTLREELFGDVNHQTDNKILFDELHKRIKNCLQGGNSAIMDATNINRKRRMKFLEELKDIPCEKICVLMATSYDECLKRSMKRERKVPHYIIEKIYYNFQYPDSDEGWDCIQICETSDF